MWLSLFSFQSNLLSPNPGMGEVLMETVKMRRWSGSFQKYKLTLNKELFPMPSQDFIPRPQEEKKLSIPY